MPSEMGSYVGTHESATTTYRPLLNLEDVDRANSLPLASSPLPLATSSVSLQALNDRSNERLPSLTPNVLSGNAVEIRRTARALGKFSLINGHV